METRSLRKLFLTCQNWGWGGTECNANHFSSPRVLPVNSSLTNVRELLTFGVSVLFQAFRCHYRGMLWFHLPLAHSSAFCGPSAGLTPRRALFSARRHAEMGRIGQAPLSTFTLQRAPRTQETFILPSQGVASWLPRHVSGITVSP